MTTFIRTPLAVGTIFVLCDVGSQQSKNQWNIMVRFYGILLEIWLIIRVVSILLNFIFYNIPDVLSWLVSVSDIRPSYLYLR